MSSDENAPPTTPAKPAPRRSSFSIVGDLFARPSVSSSSPSATDIPTSPAAPSATSSTPSSSSAPRQGSMASAMAQSAQQTRRLSITTLGLSASVPGASPFAGMKRGDSMSSAGRPGSPGRESSDPVEEAVEDGPPLGANGGGSPFQRRMSFGARAYRDNVRASAASASPPGGGGAAGSNGAASSGKASASPPGSGKNSGFNWSDTLRSRAERTSIVGPPAGGNLPLTSMHNRQKSVAESTSPPAAPAAAPRPVPKKPDAFQERILKGDFIMD